MCIRDRYRFLSPVWFCTRMTTVEAINTGLGGNKEVLKKKYYHLIILVAVSYTHLDVYKRQQRIKANPAKQKVPFPQRYCRSGTS